MTDFPYFRSWLSRSDLDPEPEGDSAAASEALSIIDDRLVNAPEGYLASKGLADAINVALLLGKPLLVTGPPGTGKTQLAAAIAWELREDKRSKTGLPLRKFETKSTSVSRDLFYTYDAIAAFRDKDDTKKRDARWYINYQALGRAILEAFEKKQVEHLLTLRDEGEDPVPFKGPRRSVVLIDEIDKAPRDFPNDLLNEIDRLYFRVAELGNRGTPGADWEEQQGEDDDVNVRKHPINPGFRPIIVITSNDEKSLPEPFLRRCVFFNIQAQDRRELERIVEKRLPEIFKGRNALVEDALGIFEQLKENPGTTGISTAEFLDWLQVLASWDLADEPLRDQEEVLKATLCALVKGERARKDAFDTLEIEAD